MNFSRVLFVSFLSVASVSAFANVKVDIMNPSAKLLKIAKAFNGYAVKCGTPAKNGNVEIEKPVFKLRMSIAKSAVRVEMKALDGSRQVGFGGEEFVAEESQINPSWITLSVGDDGRNTYFIQNPAQLNFDDVNCAKGNTSVQFIATSVVAMDGMVHSTAMNCCLLK